MKIFILSVLSILFLISCDSQQENPTAKNSSPVKKEVQTTKTPEPAHGWKGNGPNKNFYTVAENIDRDGDFYYYLNMENVFVETKEDISTLFSNEESAQEMENFFSFYESAIEVFGIDGIRDAGISSMQKEDLAVTKIFLHVPGENKTILDITGESPRLRDSLKYAPPKTGAYASFDFDPERALKLTRETARKAGGEKALGKLNDKLRELGSEINADPEKLIRSLGNEFVFMMRLKEKSGMQQNTGDQQTSPEWVPELAAMISTNEAALYETIKNSVEKQHGELEEIRENGVKKIILPSSLENPLPGKTSLAFDGKYVFYSSSSDFLDLIISTSRQDENLSQSEEFRKMTGDFPEKTNSLRYISGNLRKEIAGIIIRNLSEKQKYSIDPEAFARIFLPFRGSSATVRINKPSGVQIISRHTIEKGEEGFSPALRAPAMILTATGALPVVTFLIFGQHYDYFTAI